MTDKELIIELRGIIESQAQQIKMLEARVMELLEIIQNKVIELKSDFCSICGTSTIDALQILKSKRQVIEIPPIVPIYEEYQQFSCECNNCGNLQIAAFPEELKALIQY